MYSAFLSYSRKNADIAERIHRSLELYRIPKKFRVDQNQKHFNIFRDIHDVEIGEYAEVINQALAKSEFLIVLCSPSSRNSGYVSDEINKFLSLTGRSPGLIIPILIEGRPNSEVQESDALQDKAFPEILYEQFDEPIASDYRVHANDNYFEVKSRRREAFFQVVAKLLNTSKSEELVQRDKVMRRVRNSLLGFVIIAVTMLASWTYYDNLPKAGLSPAWLISNQDSRKSHSEFMRNLGESLAESIPTKKDDDQILVATWNIRTLGNNRGYPNRNSASLDYIARIISSFDVVAMQEVSGDREGFERVRDLLLARLGSHWRYFGSGAVEGRLGNNERLGFLYDSRSLDTDGSIDEIVLPQEILERTQLDRQIARTPVLANFLMKDHKFVIANAHIYYGRASGEKRQERLREFTALSSYLESTLAKNRLYSGQLILLGDLNFDHPDAPETKVAIEHGFSFPGNLKAAPTNIARSKPYDQIMLSWDDKHSPPCVSGYGVYDYYTVVYRLDDYSLYKSEVERVRRDKNKQTRNSKEITEDSLKKEYRNYWRSHQMSDHLPKWIELDYSCQP